jgi:hypothetical protein
VSGSRRRPFPRWGTRCQGGGGIACSFSAISNSVLLSNDVAEIFDSC